MDDYAEIVGDDVLGDADFDVIGATPRLRVPPKRAMLRLPPKPGWRGQIAPGVGMPGEGLEPLPLTPLTNNGVFTAAVHAITFQGEPQAPFRPERLVTSVRRTGAAGTLILAQSIFVGRDLQLVELANFDIEFFGPTAFGMRLSLKACGPGQKIRIPCIDSPAVAGADTVAVSMMILGRTIR